MAKKYVATFNVISFLNMTCWYVNVLYFLFAVKYTVGIMLHIFSLLEQKVNNCVRMFLHTIETKLLYIAQSYQICHSDSLNEWHTCMVMLHVQM